MGTELCTNNRGVNNDNGYDGGQYPHHRRNDC
jgi:hypothetical protein